MYYPSGDTTLILLPFCLGLQRDDNVLSDTLCDRSEGGFEPPILWTRIDWSSHSAILVTPLYFPKKDTQRPWNSSSIRWHLIVFIISLSHLIDSFITRMCFWSQRTGKTRVETSSISPSSWTALAVFASTISMRSISCRESLLGSKSSRLVHTEESFSSAPTATSRHW